MEAANAPILERCDIDSTITTSAMHRSNYGYAWANQRCVVEDGRIETVARAPFGQPFIYGGQQPHLGTNATAAGQNSYGILPGGNSVPFVHPQGFQHGYFTPPGGHQASSFPPQAAGGPVGAVPPMNGSGSQVLPGAANTTKPDSATIEEDWRTKMPFEEALPEVKCEDEGADAGQTANSTLSKACTVRLPSSPGNEEKSPGGSAKNLAFSAQHASIDAHIAKARQFEDAQALVQRVINSQVQSSNAQMQAQAQAQAQAHHQMGMPPQIQSSNAQVRHHHTGNVPQPPSLNAQASQQIGMAPQTPTSNAQERHVTDMDSHAQSSDVKAHRQTDTTGDN
ncbi:hypothetical protein ACHAQA_009254 [Verticillium albo-atrum]